MEYWKFVFLYVPTQFRIFINVSKQASREFWLVLMNNKLKSESKKTLSSSVVYYYCAW